MFAVGCVIGSTDTQALYRKVWFAGASYDQFSSIRIDPLHQDRKNLLIQHLWQIH